MFDLERGMYVATGFYISNVTLAILSIDKEINRRVVWYRKMYLLGVECSNCQNNKVTHTRTTHTKRPLTHHSLRSITHLIDHDLFSSVGWWWWWWGCSPHRNNALFCLLSSHQGSKMTSLDLLWKREWKYLLDKVKG